MIEYKGYIGAVDFDPEIDLFHGTVINTNDVITFYGASVSKLREEMQKSVEGYLEFCREQGKTPEKPFSGEFTVRMSPEMHCKLALNAERLNLDFNTYLQSVLEKVSIEDKENVLTKQTVVFANLNRKWTIARVKDSLSSELKGYYEKTYPEERLELFYRGVAEVQNLIEEKEWRLNPPKISKMLCGFWLTDKGVIGNIKRIFGILPDVGFPLWEIVDRDGELIKKTRASIPPRFFVRITEEEAKQLERKHDECRFCGVSKDKSVDCVYYDIPENIATLLPVLEFAYNKHLGN